MLRFGRRSKQREQLNLCVKKPSHACCYAHVTPAAVHTLAFPCAMTNNQDKQAKYKGPQYV